MIKIIQFTDGDEDYAFQQLEQFIHENNIYRRQIIAIDSYYSNKYGCDTINFVYETDEET